MPTQVNAAEADGPYVVLIGAPGSGKSTVSAYISDSKGFPIIEVGQLLRDEIAAASKSTARGKPGSQRFRSGNKRLQNIETAKDQLDSGTLVESQAVDAAVAVRVLAPDASRGFILDGYPGSITQAVFLDEL